MATPLLLEAASSPGRLAWLVPLVRPRLLGGARPWDPDRPSPLDGGLVASSEDELFPADLVSFGGGIGLAGTGEEPKVEEGGAGGASYESTEMCVVAGESGAPSGPMKRTFFRSALIDRVIGGVRGGADGPRSKCCSSSSLSARPGVATVLHAPLPNDWFLGGVCRESWDEVSMFERSLRGRFGGERPGETTGIV